MVSAGVDLVAEPFIDGDRSASGAMGFSNLF